VPDRYAAAAAGAVLVWATNALAAGVALERNTVLQVLALQFAAATAVLLAARSLGRHRRRRTPASHARLRPRAVALALSDWRARSRCSTPPSPPRR